MTREEEKHNAVQISLDQHPKIAALSCLPPYERLVTGLPVTSQAAVKLLIDAIWSE